MTTRKPLATEAGENLPELDPNSDVAKLIYLLEYARLRGFRIGPTVQIGDVIVQVRDVRQVEGTHHNEPDLDIWEQAGHREP